MPRVGSSKRKTCRLAAQPLGQHDFLLVAAAEVHHALAESRGLDAQIRDQAGGGRGFTAGPHDAAGGKTVEACQAGVGHDIEAEHETLPLAVLGQETEAEPDGRPGRRDRDLAAFDPDAAGVNRVDPEQGPRQLGAARAHQAGETHHLPAPQRK